MCRMLKNIGSVSSAQRLHRSVTLTVVRCAPHPSPSLTIANRPSLPLIVAVLPPRASTTSFRHLSTFISPLLNSSNGPQDQSHKTHVREALPKKEIPDPQLVDTFPKLRAPSLNSTEDLQTNISRLQIFEAPLKIRNPILNS